MRTIREFHAATHKRFSLLLEHLGKIPPNLLTMPLQGFGQPSIARQVNHILYSESTWVGALQCRIPVPWNHDETRLPVLVKWRREVADETVAYLDSLSEDALHAPLPVYPEYWVGPPRTPSFILHHIITHAFHHKGQIAAMCRMVGHPAPDTDLQRG